MTSQSHDPKGVKMSVRSKEMGGYVDVKCKQKVVNGRLNEPKLRDVGDDISLGC